MNHQVFPNSYHFKSIKAKLQLANNFRSLQRQRYDIQFSLKHNRSSGIIIAGLLLHILSEFKLVYKNYC